MLAVFNKLPAHLQRPAKFASLCALLLGLYAAAGFWWAPKLIKHYATDYVTKELHRELQLGEVRFNPFTLTLRAQRIALKDSQGELVSLNSLLVNAELSSLFTRTLHFKIIDLDAPNIHGVVDAQGKFNLDLSDPNQPKSADNEPLPAIRIDEFHLRGGQLQLSDLSRPTPLTVNLKPIEFSLQDFRTMPGHENGFHFHGQSLAKEVFDWQGDFTLQPFGSKGRISVSNLLATTLQQYTGDALPVHLLGGSVQATADYEAALNDSLSLKLTAPSVGIADLQVAPKHDITTPWVKARNVQIKQAALSLTERSAHIQSIQVDDAHITAWFDADYKLNLLDLNPPSDPDSPVWTTRIDSIALNNADIPVEDRTLSPAVAFHLAPANVRINQFNSAPGSVIDLDTDVRINDSGNFKATGKVTLDTQQTELQMTLDAFALKDLQPYVLTATDMRINGGALTTAGTLKYRGTTTSSKGKSKAPLLSYEGKVRVADFRSQDTVDNKDFINWRALELNKLRYSMTPDRLEIAEIVAQQPYGRFMIDKNGATNIQHVLRLKPAPKAATDDAAEPAAESAVRTTPAAKSQNAMLIRVGNVRVRDGSMDFSDYTVEPAFATGVGALNGNIAGLSSVNGSRAKVALKGAVDRHAPVDINGDINFLAADVFSDLTLSFRNMELTTFNPYSGKFAGYSIAKGKLATELHYQVNNRKLDAQHHIVIDQLEFGDATDSKDAVPLPIKFAVSLLKDRNGVIDLQLPVSGSIDDPKFRVGPIVWKLFKGLLTKVVTAPFAALGRLFGGGEELEYVDFAPGSSALSAAELGKLDKLARGLVERPQLKIDVPLVTLNETDLNALREAAFNDALRSVLPANATPAQQLKALTTVYQRQFSKSPEFPESAAKDATVERITFLTTAIKQGITIDPAQRDGLSRARANAVHDALAKQPDLNAERIFMTQRTSELSSPNGVVRMQLKLQ